MTLEFLNHDNSNTRLILIFNGWSATKDLISEIRILGWDVAVVSDYGDLRYFDQKVLEGYYTIYLFAWSLGVAVASRLLDADKITAAFAINGTLFPADNSFGIPVDIYNSTAEMLNSRNLLKFHKRMCGDAATFKHFSQHYEPAFYDSEVERLRTELFDIKQLCDSIPCRKLPWVRAYLSKEDRIFPHGNMTQFWRTQVDVQIVNLQSAHYVDVAEVVKSVISDLSMVKQKFTKARISYNTHAIAQYSAAVKLASLLREKSPEPHGSILEIGCGTGLFTKEYASILKPSKATFVDITNVEPFSIADHEEYVCADAEKWIAETSEQWDAILSASSIQWFANIPAFFKNCHKRLRKDGILAISTFLPGNMMELDSVRPAPLLYPDIKLLSECLADGFTDVEIVADEIRVEFQSLREMLMHLKHTGVGGSVPSSKSTLSDMSHLRSLTYKPVYIVTRKSE